MMRYNPYRRRIRRRRRNKRKKTGMVSKLNTKRMMYGAGGGALAGVLLTGAAGAARGIPSTGAMPKNAAIGAIFGAVVSMLAKSETGAGVLGALAAGTGIYMVNVMKAAAGPGDAGTAGLGACGFGACGPIEGLGIDVQEAIAGMADYVTPGSMYYGRSTLGEYVSPSQRYDGGDLGEYVTPGAMLEGLGQMGLKEGGWLQPPQGFFPGMAARARMPISWKCKTC